MTPIRELTRDEFMACFQAPMRNVGETSASVGAARAYLPHLSLDAVSLTGSVAHVYRDAGERFVQVLLATGTANVFLVVVVDLASDSAYGHRVLDLNAEYGLD